MTPEAPPETLALGPWRARRSTGELSGPHGVARLEPKVAELLFLLAERPNEVVTREEIHQRLWPEVFVGDDALARLVFKLRKALEDDPKAPRWVETLPKRGYRLRQDGAAVAAATPTVERRGWNWWNGWKRRRGLAAGWLVALLGLLGVWVGSGRGPRGADPVPAAIVERANDFYFQYARADNEAAIELFERLVGTNPDYAPASAGLANALAQRVMRWPAVAGAPAGGYTSLGAALACYHRAVELDPNAWGALINTADVLEIQGHPEQALPYLEAAYAAMTRVYSRETPRVQPWYAATATADRLCRELAERVGSAGACGRPSLNP